MLHLNVFSRKNQLNLERQTENAYCLTYSKFTNIVLHVFILKEKLIMDKINHLKSDHHDAWHFLSALSMFMSFVVMLTIDDGIIIKKRNEISVF